MAAEKPTDQEIIELEFMIRKIVREQGINIADLVQQLNDKYGMRESAPAMSRYLKSGNIPLWKARRIGELLGYTLNFEQK